MSLQNRVDPWGQFHAVSARGALMGNRGILHDQQRKIVAPWRGKAWITCKLQFQDMRRKVFGAGTYSELFFLDETTAFSAGHRPCAQCRRDRFNEFKATCIAANRGLLLTPKPTISEIDNIIHAERAAKGGDKATFDAQLMALRDGTLVEVGGVAMLVWHGELLPWTFEGYRSAAPTLPPSTTVRVLTPASVVRAFESGFIPQVHSSAKA